jgi:Planctomycete cytochrome C/Anaphase-promoting complex subunit 4 WD40 domain
MHNMMARFCLLLLVFVSVARAEDAKPTFDTNVKPILAKHCIKCHTGDRPRGELLLNSYAAVLQGGVSGKAVVSGKPGESPLYTMTAHLEEPKMPPNLPKIPQSELDTLKNWIETGLLEKSGDPTTLPRAATASDGLQPVVPLARPSAITALAATDKIAAIPGQKQVLLYDLASAKFLGGLPFSEGEVHVLRFSADGKALLAAGGIGGQSGAVIGFDTTNWKRTFTIAESIDAILAADLSADRTKVVFGGPSRLVKVASVADGKILHTFRKPTDWVLTTSFSPDGLLVAAGDRFGGVNLWETKSGKEFLTLRAHTKAVTAMAWRTDGEALATASEDGTVRIWNLHTGDEVTKWDAHPEGVLDLVWHGPHLTTAGRDKLVKTWDATGKPVQQFGPSDDVVLRVAALPGNHVLSGDWSGRLYHWTPNRSLPISLPLKPAPTKQLAIAVPVPELAAVAAPAKTSIVTSADLDRKRATLKAIEDAAEKLKDEAAREPKNAALAKAYLQLCEAALAMKSEVIAAEKQEVRK